jgi:phage repressor protein C with HTH and peptisase S24 domain
MEPLLASGDRVLIDTSQRVPVPPGIFAIWDGMGLVAKRIEHEPNSDPAMVVNKLCAGNLAVDKHRDV